MNGDLMEYWGRTMLLAFQGQNQPNSMTTWMQRAYQDAIRLNSNLFQIWGMPAPDVPRADLPNYWEKTWEAFLKAQQLFVQWVGMLSNSAGPTQAKKIAQLEEQVESQARTIEQLQRLVDRSGAGNSEMVNQFQKLIDQQSKQFQQLTSSVGEYLRSSAGEEGTPEQS